MYSNHDLSWHVQSVLEKNSGINRKDKALSVCLSVRLFSTLSFEPNDFRT